MSIEANASAANALAREIGLAIRDAVRKSKATDRMVGNETQIRGTLAAAISTACGEAIGVLVGQTEPGSRDAMLRLATEAMSGEASSVARDVAARRSS